MADATAPALPAIPGLTPALAAYFQLVNYATAASGELQGLALQAGVVIDVSITIGRPTPPAG